MNYLTTLSTATRRAAAVGASISLVVAAWFLVAAPLLSGDSATASNALSDPTDPDEVAITVQDDAADLPMPEVTYDIVLGRDPFQPVRPAVPEDPTTDPNNGESSNGDPANGDDSTGGAPGAGVDKDPPPQQGSSDVDGSASGGAINCAGQDVSLVSANSDAGNAVIRVGTDTYPVWIGEQFAGSFQLLSVSESSARVMSGDVICVLQAGGAQQK